MYKISDEVINFILKTGKWDLAAGEQTLAKVKKTLIPTRRPD